MRNISCKVHYSISQDDPSGLANRAEQVLRREENIRMRRKEPIDLPESQELGTHWLCHFLLVFQHWEKGNPQKGSLEVETRRHGNQSSPQALATLPKVNTGDNLVTPPIQDS